MPKGNLEAQKIINKEKQELRKLRELFKTPFDAKNEEHVTALKSYLDQFEFELAQKEVYKTGNRIMFGYLVYFAVTWLFRIDAFDFLAKPTLALGVMCELLNRTSKTDYANTISDMKELYNWVMKAGKDKYFEGLDSTTQMKLPQVQRFILLLAPHTTPEFMQAWPKVLVNPKTSPPSALSWMFHGTGSALHSGYSLFFSQPKSEEALNKEVQVRALKLLIEKKEVSSDVFKSISDVVTKIAQDTAFRNLVLAKGADFVKKPIMQFISSVKESGQHIVPHVKTM